jgi:hypothetical protein
MGYRKILNIHIHQPRSHALWERGCIYIRSVYISANKLQLGYGQADIRMCSHCLFPVDVTSMEVFVALLQG